MMTRLNAFVMQLKNRARISIQLVFISFIVLAATLTALVTIGSQYMFSRSLATDTTLNVYEKSANTTQSYLSELDERASASIKILAQFSQFETGQQAIDETRALFSEVLLRNPLFHSVYVGFDNGDFYGIINLDADFVTRQKLKAEPQDRWVITTISGEGAERNRVMQFVDARFQLRHTETQSTDFKSQRRPWFINAKQGEVHKTAPYLFQQLQIPGETYATRLKSGNAVIALDITLSAISSYLHKQDFGDSTQIFIYHENGELVASNTAQTSSPWLPQAPVITFTEAEQAVIKKYPKITVSSELDWPPISFSASGWPYGYSVDVLNYFSEMTGIEVRYVNGLPWKQLAQMFLDNELDVLQPVYYDPSRVLLGELTQPILDVPYGVITKTGRIQHIEELKDKTIAIPEGWLLAAQLEEVFPSLTIIRVPTVRAMFDAVREGRVDAAIDTAPSLNYIRQQFFIEDVRVSAPLDFGEVEMPHQLHFMLNKKKPELVALFDKVLASLGDHYPLALEQKWLHQRPEKTAHLGLVPYKQLIKLAQQGGTNGLITTNLSGQTFYTYVVPFKGLHDQQEYLAIITPTKDVMAAGMARVKDSIIITLAGLLFLLPLAWYLAGFLFGPIRQLAVNSKNIAQRQYELVEHVDSGIAELHDLAISMDEMSESIQDHEKAQQELLDSFIKVIAQAIDDKSAHTAGHCERVPELAFMLARKANEAEQGIFASFKIDTEDKWREFEVAAWLHDCGKITTPEHIIDKGTKLEANYNRIHEIRMRFEVLWRDAEIDYLTASSVQGANADELLIQKQVRQQQLQQDFAFIANANIGGEFMSEADIERLQSLSKMPWQRYFDNTLGLSHVELARYQPSTSSYPVTELLLDDKVEHIIPRTRKLEYPAEFGINMDIPDNLYNMGELYNLSIRAGTLTAEDRFKINEHIISTIKMLESLPFPDELKNVPRYASTHHETTIGTGYPRKLKGDQLSVPERLMVLADIYEALTAADRPYKRAKPISEALDILHKMVLRGHIDAEVFELFLRTGVYLDYAKRFLPAKQIDEVDISQYLAD